MGRKKDIRRRGTAEPHLAPVLEPAYLYRHATGLLHDCKHGFPPFCTALRGRVLPGHGLRQGGCRRGTAGCDLALQHETNSACISLQLLTFDGVVFLIESAQSGC